MRSGSESARLAAAAGGKGRRLWWQVVLTVLVVFVTFLLRAVYSLMQGNFNREYSISKLMRNTQPAVSNALQTSSNCPSACDYPCNNVYSIIQVAPA
jgi:hypothetical protein